MAAGGSQFTCYSETASRMGGYGVISLQHSTTVQWLKRGNHALLKNEFITSEPPLLLSHFWVTGFVYTKAPSSHLPWLLRTDIWVFSVQAGSTAHMWIYKNCLRNRRICKFVCATCIWLSKLLYLSCFDAKLDKFYGIKASDSNDTERTS